MIIIDNHHRWLSYTYINTHCIYCMLIFTTGEKWFGRKRTLDPIPFINYTVDYSHHLIIHDVLYSIRHLVNEWELKYKFHHMCLTHRHTINLIPQSNIIGQEQPLCSVTNAAIYTPNWAWWRVAVRLEKSLCALLKIGLL